MSINIYSLYLTFNNYDRDTLYKVLNDIIINKEKTNKLNKLNDNIIKILHIRFHKGDELHTVRNINKSLDCEYITIINNQLNITQLKINKINDIIQLFRNNTQNKNNKKLLSVFMYSGHSNGMHFVHNKIHLITIKDFSYIIIKTLKKKADIIIIDACLCGSINFLNNVKNCTNYVIASPSYFIYTSYLSMKSILDYPEKKDIILYGKNIINEYVKSVKSEFVYKDFALNLVLYEINENLIELIKIVKKYKNDYNMHKCKINKNDYYYIDIICGLKNINYNNMNDINNKMKSIVKYQKYYDIGNNLITKMIVILKKPSKFVINPDEFFIK